MNLKGRKTVEGLSHRPRLEEGTSINEAIPRENLTPFSLSRLDEPSRITLSSVLLDYEIVSDNSRNYLLYYTRRIYTIIYFEKDSLKNIGIKHIKNLYNYTTIYYY